MPADLTVATLNLFNNPHGRWPERAPLVAEQAVQLDADVYMFQEVDSGSDQVERLLDALGRGFAAVPLANPAAGSIKSLAVLTRLEVTARDECLDLGADDIALRVRLAPDDGAEVEIVTTHLHYSPTRAGSDVRSAQVRRLLAWLGPVGARRLVLTGDFNATPAGETVRTIKRCLRSAHEVANGEEPAWTNPTPLVRAVDCQAAFGIPALPEGPGSAIDYVFVSPGVEVRSCRVCFDVPAAGEFDLFPSDHLGLVARLTLG